MNLLLPQKPGNLQFSSITSDSMNVAWSYTTPFNRFEVAYGRDDQWPNPIDKKHTTTRNLRITGLQPETKYFIQVRAEDGTGLSPESEGIATTKAGIAKPVAPTGFSARPTKNSVALTWQKSTLASGYRVSYGLLPNGPVINTIPATVEACTVSGLRSGTAYYFDLVAFNAAGDSPSVRTTATTLAVPAAPTNLHATPAIASMVLAWSPSAGAIEYVIRYGIEPNGPAQTKSSVQPSFELTGLTKNTLYFVEVSAVNANGESSPARITEKTLDGPAIPSKPGTLHTLLTFDQVRVTWGPPQSPNYELAYGLVDKYPEVIGRQTTANLTDTLKYLAPATRYFIEVRGFNASGFSEPSSAEVTIGPDQTQPRGLHNPGRTFSEAWLKWERPEDLSYFIDYEITCPGREPVRTTALEHIFTDLIPEKAYTFKLQTRRIEGPAPALPVSIQVVTHDRVPPTKPRELKLIASTPGNATLNWSAPEDNVGVTGYQVRRNDGAWAAVSGTSHPVTGLIEGAVERFEVRARDAAGNWSVSADVSTRKKVAPGAPRNFRYSTSVLLSILRWDAPIDGMDVIDYRIILTGPQGRDLHYTADGTMLTPLLLANTRYDVRITARNAVGESLPLIAEMTTK